MTRDSWFAAGCVSLLAYSTGARTGEIAQLQLGDVHVDGVAPYIAIRRATAKNDGSARCIALNAQALWAARILLERAALLGAVEPQHFLLPANLSKHTR